MGLLLGFGVLPKSPVFFFSLSRFLSDFRPFILAVQAFLLPLVFKRLCLESNPIQSNLIGLLLQVQGLETEMSDIGKWLVSAGQTLLTESRIGMSTSEAESLLREHEAIELKCRVKLPLLFYLLPG